LYQQLSEAIAKDVKLNRDGGKQSGQEAAKIYANAVRVNIGVAVVTILIGLALAIQVTVSIVRPLAKAVEVTREIAGGDLTVSVSDPG
ncbi:hypothetical protein Q6271_27985, partial [Klebsiella pneumoniae]|nr:hypothetical protein [Klebsiella pneumoniae]